MKDRAIGFIDSGYGGLSLVRQSLLQLPYESIIYLGDNGRAPYGTRPISQVNAYINQLADFLMTKEIKFLVVACNTGTAAALKDLKSRLPIPVVGVIHAGSRAAIKQSKTGRIGIIGTPATIQSGIYQRVIQEKNDQVQTLSLACPEFVEIVENHEIYEPGSQGIVDRSLKAFKDHPVDTLILGCTHYPMLKSLIQKSLGSRVQLLDSGVETLDEVASLLDYFDMTRTAAAAQAQPPSQVFYTTGSTELFEEFALAWLEVDQVCVRQVNIEGENLVEVDYSQPK